MCLNNRFDLVNNVLAEALDLPAGERQAFLEVHCGADPDLLAEAHRLLSLSNALDGFLDSPSATRSGLAPGDVLGERFVILNEIAAGGTGSVYRVEDRQLGEVALKVLHPEMAHDSHVLDRFFTEIKTTRAIRHPHVCPVYDLVQFDHPQCGQVVAYTMKYLHGETLASRLARAPISMPEVIGLARGMAAGIDAFHAEGIIHRDLKPENIMLSTGTHGSTIPVIMDFGLASPPAICAPRQEAISGSLQYMAPEQFRGTDTAPATDIYAFGIILFEMITGIRPFPSEELLPAAIRRVTAEPPRLSGLIPCIPPAWDRAIARALSRRPADRPVSARALVDEMEGGPAKDGRRPMPVAHRCRHARAGMSRRAIAHGSNA
jgi:serine/threonine protein kinase